MNTVVSEARTTATHAWARVLDWCNEPIAQLGEVSITPFTILGVGLALVAAFVTSFVLRRALDRLARDRGSMHRATLYTLGRVLHYTLIGIGLAVGLSSVGLDLSKFTLLVSALGLGIGFGLQQIFSNFVSGLIILFDRSLKVGDLIELQSGIFGEVMEIGIRATVVRTFDNADVLVPNSEFVNGRVVNLSMRETARRLRVPFGVAYGTDKELVRTAGLEAAEAVPETLRGVPSREPSVWLVNFGDSSLDFELVVWIDQKMAQGPSTILAKYLWEIHSALERHKIEIPFPQRDLHLRSGFQPIRADRSGSLGAFDEADS